MADIFIADTHSCIQHRCHTIYWRDWCSPTASRSCAGKQRQSGSSCVWGQRGGWWKQKVFDVWQARPPPPAAVLVTNTCYKSGGEPGFCFGVGTRVIVKSQDCSQFYQRAETKSTHGKLPCFQGDKFKRETFPVMSEVTKDKSILTLTVSCTLRSRKLFVCLKKSHVQFITGELCLNSCVDKCVFFPLKKLRVVNISWTTAESHSSFSITKYPSSNRVMQKKKSRLSKVCSSSAGQPLEGGVLAQV